MAVEYIHFEKRPYCERSEVALNFLTHEVYGEPYNPFPEEMAPVIFEAIEDNNLIAAAAVGESIRYTNQPLLELMGVAETRRGQGVGSGLLRFVEQRMASVGFQVLYTTLPLSERSREFYLHRNYAPDPSDPQYLAKVL